MNIWIVFGLNLIHQITAVEITGNYFKLVKSIRANLNPTRVYMTRSVRECATECSSSDGCSRANFYDSTCEFLEYLPGMGEIDLVEEQNSKYICK